MKRRRKNIEWVTTFRNLWPIFTNMLSIIDVLTLGDTCKSLQNLTEGMICPQTWDEYRMREVYIVFKSLFRTRQWVRQMDDGRGCGHWTHVKNSKHCLEIDLDYGIICSVYCTECTDFCFHDFLCVKVMSRVRGRGIIIDCVKRLQQFLLSKDVDLKQCNRWCHCQWCQDCNL